MEVVWSDLALTQLDEVMDYVEEHFGLLTSQKVLHNILEKTDELAQYSTHGIYDARYTSWVSGQDMVIRHLLLAPNRVYYCKHPTPILAVWTISATFAPC